VREKGGGARQVKVPKKGNGRKRRGDVPPLKENLRLKSLGPASPPLREEKSRKKLLPLRSKRGAFAGTNRIKSNHHPDGCQKRGLSRRVS